MPISTLSNTNSKTASNVFFYIMTIAGLVAAIFFAFKLLSNLDSFKKKSALTVDVYNGTAEVFINGASVGKTPFSSREIQAGDNDVRVKSDSREYATQISFMPNDSKYIHNVGIFTDLGTSDVFSSVQEFWFEKNRSGDSLKIVSDPANASVYIDNIEVGKTPYSSDKLSEGEYDLRLEYPGFETQTARINIKKGYTLNIRIKQFPTPAPALVNLLEGATNFYNVSLDNQLVTTDTQSWVNALVYWNKTRGLNIEGTGLNKELVFDYFIDYKGNLYSSAGVLITDPATTTALKDAKRGAYLGRISDGTGITESAKKAVFAINSAGLGGKQATILNTGLGWLRVRNIAGLAGNEIAKVNVGESFPVLEEKTGWVKIKVSDTVEGWVSADYVKLSE